MPFVLVSRARLATCQIAYLGHDWLAVFVGDVAEGHFRALVLVDSNLGVVDEWNCLQRNCRKTRSGRWRPAQDRCLTLVLHDHPRHPDGGIRRHLDWAQPTSFKALLAQLRSAV